MQPHYWNDAKRHLSQQCPVMKRLIAQYKGEGLRARGDGFYTLLRSIVGQQISVKAADAVWAKLAAKVTPLTPEMLLSLSDEQLRACGLSASKVAYAKNVAEFYLERGIVAERTSPFRGEVGRRPGGGQRSETGNQKSEQEDSFRLQVSDFRLQTPTRASRDLPPKGGGTLPEREYWTQRSDEAVISELTAIKGIGTWTAEMFLIFHLLRPDVFPVKDLGLLKAINLTLVAPQNLQKQKWLKPKEYKEIAARWQPYRTVATWYLWRSLDPVAVAY